jgi:serine/threonine-protein kinase HipA
MVGDSLPDDFGNALVTAWLAARGVPRDSITTLDRLAYMGRRGMGALEFHPASGQQRNSKAPLEMKKMVEAARRILEGNFDGDVEAQAALANIIQVGTSAGGARAKAVIAWNPETQEIRSGQFDVDDGFEHWLLKFDGVGKDMELGTSSDYGRIEYAYYLMAKAAKIDMTQCRLLQENGRAHFMTKRFDRIGNVRHHMHSLCAMAHLDYKQRGTHAYEQLFMTLDALNLGDAASEQAFRRMTFNVVARNCDDHTKNFSFLLPQGGEWQLSPAYDITHAHNPKGEWTSQHLMSVNGKFDDISRDDLLTVAERFSVPHAKSAIQEVQDAVARWHEFSQAAGVSQTESDRVARDFKFLTRSPTPTGKR